MSFSSRKSCRLRGQPPQFEPLADGQENSTFLGYSSKFHPWSLFWSPTPPIIQSPAKMSSPWTRSPIAESTSSFVAGSISIINTFSHSNPTNHSTNPQKVIKKLVIFQYEVDADATPWLVKSPLNLAPPTDSLPKFKDHLLKSLGNGVTTTNEHSA